MSARMTGKCKWFHEQKGYGFIEGDDGREYFVHYKNIQGDGFKNLSEMQRVTFIADQGPKGAKAVEVQPVPLAA